MRAGVHTIKHSAEACIPIRQNGQDGEGASCNETWGRVFTIIKHSAGGANTIKHERGGAYTIYTMQYAGDHMI